MIRFLSILLVLLGLGFSSFAQTKVIHVYVALCDNENQGIVPVPKLIGNGQDPFNNLYWGALYGIKTHFKKNKNWQLLETIKNPKTNILERCIFKHTTHDAIMVADAYDGAFMKNTVVDFLQSTSGNTKESITLNDKTLAIAGKANLIAFIGHNGLMDFRLDNYPTKANDDKRETVILACVSKSYFGEAILKAGATPLVWSTGLMSPEAYTLEYLLRGWLAGETNEQIRERAAQGYHDYQKCGINGAKRLLVTGF